MERKDILDKYKWKLEDLYEDTSMYNKDLESLGHLVLDFTNYKGRIMESSNTLLEVLELNEKIDMLTNKLYVYINMKLHEDTRVSKYQELSGNLDIVLTVVNEKTAFFIPELLKSDYKDVLKYIDENKVN